MTDIELINNFLTELKRVEGRKFLPFEETIPTESQYRLKDEDVKIWLASLETHGYICSHSADKSNQNGIWAIEPKGHFALKNGGLTQETLDNLIKSTFGENTQTKKTELTTQQFNIGKVGNFNTGNISGRLNQTYFQATETPTVKETTIKKLIVGVIIGLLTLLIGYYLFGIT